MTVIVVSPTVAKRMFEEAVVKEFDDCLRYINNSIIMAADECSQSVSVCVKKTICAKVVEHLKSLGYEVSCTGVSGKNETVYISWR